MGNKNIKLLVFDLDSTLAPIGQGMGEEELSYLRKLNKTGIHIAVASGKSCDYLCGFLRQAGLADVAMIGENGAVIRIGTELPPRKYYELPAACQAKAALQRVREILDENFTDLWYQPSQIEVTPFPKDKSQLDKIEECIADHKEEFPGITIYRQSDCFDFIPEGIDKAAGISCLLQELKLDWENVMAIGDGINDYCMFDRAAVSLGVNVKEKERVDYNFESTKEMLKSLVKFIDFLP